MSVATAVKVCTFEGCDKPFSAKGLCRTHYEQHRRGKELHPIGYPPGRRPSVCTFDGCERRYDSNGYCSGHRDQWKKGKELTPLRLVRKVGDAEKEFASGVRTCSPNSGCGRTLPLSDFHKGTTSVGLHSLCRDCARESGLKYKYGLSAAAWESLFDSQGRCCAVCRTSDAGRKGWATDHDHGCCPGQATCGRCIRSIVCNGCNFIVGCIESHPNQAALLTYISDNHVQLSAADYESAAAFYGWDEGGAT